MNVTYQCPKCDETARAEFTETSPALGCACGHKIEIPPKVVEDGSVHRCLACPSTELFVRKDFPQRIGVTIVVVGFVLSSITWYFYYWWYTFGILFGTALIDLLLYLLMGNSLVCYRCGAEYRGVEATDVQAPFNLEIHERYRQQAARAAE